MKQKVLLFFLSLMFFQFTWSQTRPISGRVTKEGTTEYLSGVTVSLKGTKTNTATNNEGRFTIAVPTSGNATLVFTSVGFGAIEVAVGNQQSVEVTLREETTVLNDVVVVGYQTVRRRDLTGSVASVNARQLRDIPINSAAEALTGRLAGVQVTGTEGTPNAEVLIRVRGGGSITQDNSPLYIIDGVQVENALSVISPQDIETVDVLKDASSTAIYGSRGANGVVIITTKSGRNQKPVISYNGSFGVDKLANKLDVMSPYDFVNYQYERSRGSSAAEASFLSTYGHYKDLDLYKNVPFADWQEEMFGRYAKRQNHNVSLTGGNAGTTYNLSLTYNKQEGLQLGSEFDRKLVNFKFDHTFSNRLRVGFTTRYNNTEVDGAGTSNAGSSSTNRLRHSVKYRPFLLPGQALDDYDENYANETNQNSLRLVNPILLNAAEYRNEKSNLINLSGYAELKLTNFLTFRSTLGYDMQNRRREAFDDSITNNSQLNGMEMPLAGLNLQNRVSINNSNVLTFTNSKLGGSFSAKNKITALAGQEIYENRVVGNNVIGRYFPNGIAPKRALANFNLGTTFTDNSNPPAYEDEDRLLSFFGRVMYDYDQRFLTQFTFRGDGSSKFGPSNKWGYFPSASVAWRISQEKFFEPIKSKINDLKLRVSYGKAGNNRIGNFLYITQFNSNTQYWLNNQQTTGFAPEALANALLKWETTVTRNVGLDMSFLRGRIQFSADAYSNTTEDLLIDRPIGTTSGYTTQFQNVASTSSKGVEFQLNASIIAKKDFTWDASFNASLNRVKVEELGSFLDFYYRNSGWGFSNSAPDYLIKKGELLGSIYGFVTDGFYKIEDFDYAGGVYTLKTGIGSNSNYTSAAPAPGRLKFRDLDNNGLINEDDKQIIGVAQPKIFGGLNQQFRYKNFDLSIFVNYQFGNDVYNANKLEFTNGYQANANMLTLMNDRWRTVNSEGTVVTDPAELAKLNANAKLWIPSTTSTSFVLHSWAVEDGSFVRINNVTIGYNFSSSLLKRAKIQSARLYATGNNLAIFTNYSGYDPEVSTRRRTPETPGVDYSAYPRSRAFLVGLNLSF